MDYATKNRIPVLDLNPAADWGLMVPLTFGPVTPENLSQHSDAIRSAAEDIRPCDYILCVGDTVLTAMLMCLAWENRVCSAEDTTLRCLRWDRRARSYMLLEVEL